MTTYTRTHRGHTMHVHAPEDATAFDADAFARFTASDTILGLDVETRAIVQGSAGPFGPDAGVRLVQFGSLTDAWVLNPVVPEHRAAIETTLNNPRIRFASHTAYDPLCVWASLGIPLGQRAIDTHLLSKLIDPDERAGHGLKELAARHLDPGLGEAETALLERMQALAPTGQRAGKKAQRWGWNNLPVTDEAYTVYAGLDAIYARRLLPVLLDKCAPYGHLVRMEQWLAAQSTGITIRGLALDMEYTARLLAETLAQYDAADAVIRKELRFSGNSPKFATWLETLGVRGMPRTDTGQIQVTRDSLTALMDDVASGKRTFPPRYRPLLSARLEMAQTKNVITNLRQFLKAADANGRIHPTINTLRAKTARMSITGPPLQTLKKFDPRLRHCLRADPGHVLVACDFSQVEIRVAAALAKDPTLIGVIHSGVDIHSATAELMYGPGYTKEDRTISKRATFGTVYGGGVRALAQQTGVDLATAQSVIDRWRRTYPAVIRYGRRLSAMKVVTTVTGRRIPADPIRSYANCNYAIQSSARDLLVAAVYTLATRHGLHARLWLFVHDEVIVQVPAEHAEEVRDLMGRVMTGTFRGVRIEAEAEILGTHWGALQEAPDSLAA
ncbi:DNA polymerase [Embleya sp. NPDC005575]|uniref:DNA polymerase n=1 Tax=Embleya sp. NPDC005575 TaxID=3156892 RepID=UPI0033ABF62F